jgi:hypothetical protein
MRTKFLNQSLILFLFTLLLLSCRGKEHPPISFYYWKQTFELTKEQSTMLKEANVKRLFVKFFDVILDENKQAKPMSKIDFKQSTNLEVVPCVFIQNEVFLDNKQVENLAKKISKLIIDIAHHQKLKVHEVQIDCDWTQGTRDSYFSFLKEMQKQQANINLVCTIRLHQIKYQKSSGIPPVKKGLLMCYNMDEIDEFTTPNSIVSQKVFKQYIQENTNYPIALDLALPIYQWGLIFRLGKLNIISNDLNSDDLKNRSISKVGENTFKVKENVVVNQTNLCKGDLIRFETSPQEDLFQMAKHFKKTNLTFDQLIFYHISQDNLNTYHEATLSEINSLIP